MSGHSKWSKIKRDKASNDAKKGAVFTKLGNQIAVAARQGADPTLNGALALAIETAKSFNMPQNTIQRAIQRAADKAAAQLEEVLYEGYGPGGLAILVQCATDNRKRTYPEVKSTFAKNGGNIAEEGAVNFNFKHCGEIILSRSDDDIVMQVLEAGAEDALETEDQHLSVMTAPSALHEVLRKLRAADLPIVHAALVYQPKVTLSLDAPALMKAEKLLLALESLDDTTEVYSNLAQ